MNRFQRLALAATPNAASVANYCDHAEHNEHVEAAGAALERLALELAAASDVDLLEAYAERLAAIEARNVLARPGGFEGRAAARDAKTWRDLQLVQGRARPALPPRRHRDRPPRPVTPLRLPTGQDRRRVRHPTTRPTCSPAVSRTRCCSQSSCGR